MKKLALSVALAGILATSAMAENEGWFIGASLAQHSVSSKVEEDIGSYHFSGTTSGIKYGLLGGYHQTFGENLGARYYAVLDFGNYTTNFNANADALYSFMKNEDMELRGFGGLWLGYVSYDGDISGFDLGLNLGARLIFKEQHGVELFGKFGFLDNKEDSYLITIKQSQPYQIGLRYTFSF